MVLCSYACKESNQNKIKNTNKMASFDTAQLAKTGEMLDEDIFWAIIDESLKNSKAQEEQEQLLVNKIEKLTPKEIIGFHLRTNKLLYDTYTSEMWCAGYIMNGGCSDDGFEYFRSWIISRGKEVYYIAKEHPDNLISEAKNDEMYDFEGFSYIALQAFENKTGKDLYDFISTTQEGGYPKIVFTWQEGNPESMRKICPKLYSMFN
jgi:hypothetical protein